MEGYRKHCGEKSEGYYFPTMQHISAETCCGTENYSINSQELLRDHFDKTREYKGENYGWICGALLTSLDYTHNNPWWDHLMHHGKAVSLFGDHYGGLSVEDQQHYFRDFVVDFARLPPLPLALPRGAFHAGLATLVCGLVRGVRGGERRGGARRCGAAHVVPVGPARLGHAAHFQHPGLRAPGETRCRRSHAHTCSTHLHTHTHTHAFVLNMSFLVPQLRQQILLEPKIRMRNRLTCAAEGLQNLDNPHAGHSSDGEQRHGTHG